MQLSLESRVRTTLSALQAWASVQPYRTVRSRVSVKCKDLHNAIQSGLYMSPGTLYCSSTVLEWGGDEHSFRSCTSVRDLGQHLLELSRKHRTCIVDSSNRTTWIQQRVYVTDRTCTLYSAVTPPKYAQNTAYANILYRVCTVQIRTLLAHYLAWMFSVPRIFEHFLINKGVSVYMGSLQTHLYDINTPVCKINVLYQVYGYMYTGETVTKIGNFALFHFFSRT